MNAQQIIQLFNNYKKEIVKITYIDEENKEKVSKECNLRHLDEEQQFVIVNSLSSGRPNKMIYFDQIHDISAKMEDVNKFFKIVTVRGESKLMYVTCQTAIELMGFDLTKNCIHSVLKTECIAVVPLDEKINANVIIPLLNNGKISNVVYANDSLEMKITFCSPDVAPNVDKNIWNKSKIVTIEYLINGVCSGIIEKVDPQEFHQIDNKLYIISYFSFPFSPEDVIVKKVEDFILFKKESGRPGVKVDTSMLEFTGCMAPHLNYNNLDKMKSISSIFNQLLLKLQTSQNENYRVKIINKPGEWLYRRTEFLKFKLFENSYLSEEKYPFVTKSQIENIIARHNEPQIETKNIFIDTELNFDVTKKSGGLKKLLKKNVLSFTFMENTGSNLLLSLNLPYSNLSKLPLIINQVVKIALDNGQEYLGRVIDENIVQFKDGLTYIYTIEKLFGAYEINVLNGCLTNKNEGLFFYQNEKNKVDDIAPGDWIDGLCGGINKVRCIHYLRGIGCATVIQLENGAWFYLDLHSKVKLATSSESALPDLANYLISLYDEIADVISLPESQFYLYDEEINHSSVSRTFDVLKKAMLQKFSQSYKTVGSRYSYLENNDEEFTQMITHLLGLCKAYDKYQKGTLQTKYEDIRVMMNTILECKNKDTEILEYVGLDMEMYQIVRSERKDRCIRRL